MKVQNLMTAKVETCWADDSLEVSAKIMWEKDCGFVPVVDAEYRVTGVLTDRDICMAAYTQGKKLAEITVRSAMAHQVFTCRDDEPIRAAEELMRDAQVRRLPVVDADGRLVGVISLGDIAGEEHYERHARNQEVTADEVADTLAAISAPTHPNMAAPGA
jgi:CBS domain-containing protein